MHDAFDLATELRQHLCAGSNLMWQGRSRSVLLQGRLSLSHDEVVTGETASVVIEVPQQWQTIPPLARSYEAWIKRGVEWHSSSNFDRVLCYVFTGHWQHHLGRLSSRSLDKSVAHYAANWCVNSLAWLLYRHLYAYEHGITKWNSAWGGWAHSPDEAWQDFEKLKQGGKI
ncbi:MAG: hypothetical protein KDK99_07900 [Verrucomicrobiales bacterium]|nr:hypothetical protein [Verrucomicrobiales bacterium]